MNDDSTLKSGHLDNEQVNTLFNIMLGIMIPVSSIVTLMIIAYYYRGLSHRKILLATLSESGVKVPVKLDNFFTNTTGGRHKKRGFVHYGCAAHFETLLNPKTGEQFKVTIEDYRLFDLSNYRKHSVAETPFFITYSPENVNQFALDFELTAPYTAKPYMMYYYIFSYILTFLACTIVLIKNVEVIILQLSIQIVILVVFKYYYCTFYSKNIEVTNILAKGVTVKPVNDAKAIHAVAIAPVMNDGKITSDTYVCPSSCNDDNTSNQDPNQNSSIYVSVGYAAQDDN